MLIDMKHLKEKQHYIDLYDTFTVDKCRKAERYHEDLDDSIFEKAKEKPTAYDIARVKYVTKEMHVHFTAGEEYRNKSETIRQWMERDIQLDARVESAEEPQLIRCKTCTSKMTCTSRDIWGLENKVQFFFECPNKCLPHRVIYGDGSEFKSKPVLCEKCDNEMSRNSERLQEQIVTTTYYCSGCTHTYTNELDLSPKEEVVDPDFEKEREEKKEIYDEVKALQKLTIPQLKTYLVELFENETYSNLIFEKPDMGRIVSVEFSVEEMETDNERASMQKLKKLLQKHLEKTNWRLMSDGVSYRLGILSGRIRIYEDQDDLAKLIEKKK